MEKGQPDKIIPVTVDTVLQVSRVKPALARLISWRATAVNVSCEVGSHGLMVRGFLEVTIVYAGYDDDGRIAGVFQHNWTYGANTAIPFETRWDGDYSGEEWRINPRIRVTQAEMAIKSHYEVHCRARLSCQVSIARVGQQEIVVDVTPVGNELIDTQKQLLELEEYIGETNGQIEMDLPLELPFGQPELERILDYHGSLHDVTVEAAPGKLLVEGNLHLGLLYLTEVGDAPKLNYIEWTSGIPVAGVIDFPDVQPEMLLRTYPALEALQLEMNGDRSLRLTGTVGIQSSARAPRALMNVTDCATVVPVDPETRPSMLFYVVQSGDTLWKVARRYNSTVATLARVNGLLDPHAIMPGQKLMIPKMVMGM